MDNCLITGITGLIGSNLAKSLLKQGYNVVGIGIDKLEYDNLDIMGIKNDVVYCEGNILDERFLQRVINGYEINHIYHLAAVSIVRTANAMPLITLHTNVIGTGNVLEAARQAPTIQSCICCSSDKVYGQCSELPYKEGKTLLNGLTPYEASKSLCDQWTQMYGKNYGLPVAAVRPCNAFGPGDFNFSRLVPNSITRFLRGEQPVLWSDVKDYVREFIYVEDLCAALVNLSNMLVICEEEKYGEGFNVGSGKTYKVLDFINLIREVGNFKPEVAIVDKDVAFKEIPEQYLDSEKINTYAKWNFSLSRTYNNIESCIKETIDWYKALLEEKE